MLERFAEFNTHAPGMMSVMFDKPEDAEYAIKSMNGKTIEETGKLLVVREDRGMGYDN